MPEAACNLDDGVRTAAWDDIMEIARRNGLILAGYGGTVTLMHPETQRAEGLRCKCLHMAGLGPHPGKPGAPDAHCACLRNGDGPCPMDGDEGSAAE
jgi:hypothetical protein